MRQLCLMNSNRLEHLAKFFDQAAGKIQRDKMSESNQDLSQIKTQKEEWKINYRIIAFCENKITELIKN